jgi:hypothetical protein
LWRAEARSRPVILGAPTLASPTVVLTLIGQAYAAEAPLATRATAAATLTLPSPRRAISRHAG